MPWDLDIDGTPLSACRDFKKFKMTKLFETDDAAKARAAAQIAHAHSGEELLRILATVEPEMRDLIREAVARLGRRV